MTKRTGVVFLGVAFLCAGAQVVTAQPVRIAGAVDPVRTVTARGIMHPLTRTATDMGAVEPTFPLGYMQLMTVPSAAQSAALDQLLAAQQNPLSPQYRQWLTPEQYADRFGLSASDMAKISQWLTSAGFKIEYTARGRNWIAFSGTAAQVEAAFQAPVHRYSIENAAGNGESHYGISSEPVLPAAIAPLVGTILGLDDFSLTASVHPNYTSNGATSLAPGDLATIYDLKRLYQQGINGTGERIAIVGQTRVNLADIQNFRSNYGLSPANIVTVLNGTDPGVQASQLTEADIDLEWAGAVAPNAQLIFVYSTSAVGSAMYAIDQNLAPVVSQSFGNCEANDPASYPTTFEPAAKEGNALGITWIAASGDTGAPECDTVSETTASGGVGVKFPSSIPEVTSVGGTEFNEGKLSYWSSTNGANGGSALTYIPEMAWNDTPLGTGLTPDLNAGGGGPSMWFTKPSWQTGPGVPADGRRDLPDISLTASGQHDAFNVLTAGRWILDGGTSAATPVFAGMLALMNQYTGTNGQGNINPVLYAAAGSAPQMFHDITAGNTNVPCNGGVGCVSGKIGYAAGPGYDMATGLGSVDAGNLLAGWTSLSTTNPAVFNLSPPSVLAGSAAFTLTVNGMNFVSGSQVLWNNAALPTTFVSSSQLTATVSAALVASAGNATLRVSAGAASSGAISFVTATASSSVTVSGQKMITQAPTACGSFPAVSYFAPNMTALLYFSATVSASDQLTSIWTAPDGTQIPAGAWSEKTAGNFCLWSAPISLASLPASQLGIWSAMVYDNGTLLFSLQFPVTCSLTAAPSITSIDSASSYGGYPYFTAGSWLEIKGTNLADPADPRLAAATNPGQWTGNDFNGVNAPVNLDGVTVSVDGKPAYVWFLSQGQLNVQAPQDSATGNAPIVVTTCQGTSTAFNFAEQALAPGVLAPPTYSSNGKQYLVATFYSDGAYVLNTSLGASFGVAARPAKPGDLILAYGVGFGGVTPAIAPGTLVEQANALASPVTVSFGSANASLAYQGLAPNFVGLYEFYITVPAGLADGDYQINFSQNGAAIPQTVYLTVQN